MSDDLQDLIDGYLDERLSSEQAQQLNDAIKQNPAAARRFAQAALLHDRLSAEFRIGQLADTDRRELRIAPQALPSRRRWTVTAFVTVAAIVLLAVFVWPHAGSVSASAAVVALDRVIAAASQPVDRAYRIRVTDYGPAGPPPQVFSDERGRKPGIDGAKLFVRGSDKFVLVRRFGDGTEFITGSNGSQGWAVAPTGHVHLSHDARRFRRAVPGEHESIPFLDFQTGFRSLRKAYHLTLVQSDPDEQDWSRLDAVKRSDHGREPGHVQIWFDATGVAQRIALSDLAAGPGEPRAVTLELIGQQDLGPSFFEHTSHHAADRPLDWE